MMFGECEPGPVVERVQRGARLLDSKVPSWEDRIDISQLEVTSALTCPLGQASGLSYSAGLCLVDLGQIEAPMYGFALYRADDGPMLNEAWRELIARRRLLKTLEPAVVYAEAAS